MQRGKKIIALTLTLLLVLSTLSTLTFAAPNYSPLPEGYLVVDASWANVKEQGDIFDAELGGVLYQIEYGVTAFASVEDATAAWLPPEVERTIVLAPGEYTGMTIASDVHLVGPYFGKNPNNNPNLSDYDSGKESWSLKNNRSVDPTKEAVFTGDLDITTGCNELTLDGLAFTGNGRIDDSARADDAIEVNYYFNNLFFYDCGSTSIVYVTGKTKLNRYVYIDSMRAEKCPSIGRLVYYTAETLSFTNSFVKNIGSFGTSDNVQFYCDAVDEPYSLSIDKKLYNNFENCHFEDIGGINFLNFGVRTDTIPGAEKRGRVIFRVVNNEFVDVGNGNGSGTARTIQNQICGANQECYVIGNIFKRTSTLFGSKNEAYNVYVGSADSGSVFAHQQLENNTFSGFTTAFSASNGAPAARYGSGNTISGGSLAGGNAVAATDTDNLLSSGDGAYVLNYNSNRKLLIYPTEEQIVNGAFDFANVGAVPAPGTTVNYYLDENCQGTPLVNLSIDPSNPKHILYCKAENEGKVEIYTVNLYAKPASGSSSGSSECELFKINVRGATSILRDGYGAYTIDVPAGTKRIYPKVNVSKNATYSFYFDKECKYPAASTDSVALNAKTNIFYVRVTAENGTQSKAIPVTVNTTRKSVVYADTANVPSYARKAVNYLNTEGYGVFTGDQKGNLNPRANITRYELAKVMVVLSGINVEMADSIKIERVYDDFFDMQKNASWALPYVKAATAAGLIQGVADNGKLYFDGDAYTTREQFTTVFLRALTTADGTSINKLYKKDAKAIEKAFKGKYADADNISSWALKAVKLANFKKYVNGDGRNFNPTANIIRADVAVIVYNQAIA